MVALGTLQVLHGTSVTLFNRKGPKVNPLTAKDIKRLRKQVGEIIGNEWRAVVNGIAFVVVVDK